MLSIITSALLAAAAANMTQAPVPGVPLGDVAARERAVAIAVGDRLPRFDNLRPGTRTYIRYRVLNDVWRPIDIWRRELRFEEQDGQRRLHILQSWTGPVGAVSNLDIDSWFEAGTFAPISHERRNVRGEEVRNEGFQFTPTGVRALASTPANSRAGFTLDTPQRPFNFETDMETVQALPLAEGYAARLRFYHPGGSSPPSDWIFRVTGSTRLSFGGGQVDSWIVSLEAAEGPPLVAGRFYVAKQGQQVLRVEQPMPGGMVVKVLIDSTAPAPA